jgi:hypothetical protein
VLRPTAHTGVELLWRRLKQDGAMDETSARNTRVFGHLISREPLIVWGPSDMPYLAGPGSTLGPLIGNRRAWFLITPAWSREDEGLFQKDIEHFAGLRALYPEHRHIVLCNMPGELENYRKAGQPAIVANAGIFIDEWKFHIPKQEPKRFDAIYNAKLAPYKQHELCANIEKLGLIYHRQGEFDDPVSYPARVRALLPQAIYINDLDGEFRHLVADEIVGWLGRSHVGLCLSAIEGHMQACTEYLLCGLPVVSIPNLGGRDRMLDPAYSIETEPTPEAVARAVQTLKARRLDPYRIRAAVLEKRRSDRARLFQLIVAIYREENIPFPADADWSRLFRLKLWPHKSAADLLAETAIAETRTGQVAMAHAPAGY